MQGCRRHQGALAVAVVDRHEEVVVEDSLLVEDDPDLASAGMQRGLVVVAVLVADLPRAALAVHEVAQHDHPRLGQVLQRLLAEPALGQALSPIVLKLTSCPSSSHSLRQEE